MALDKLFKRYFSPWIFWGGISLPMCFLGVGTDSDSFRVMSTIKTFISTGLYIPSRNPGFPVFEWINTAIFAGFGVVGITVATLIVSVGSLFFIEKTLVELKCSHSKWITACVAFNSLFWCNATSVMDYNWAVFGLSMAVYSWVKGWRVRMILATVLAIGCRITSGIFPIAILAYHLLRRIFPDMKPASPLEVPSVSLAFLSGFVGALFYIPSWINSGMTLRFLKTASSNQGNWSVMSYCARFIYKNIYFLGSLATVLVVFFIVSSLAQGHFSSWFKSRMKSPFWVISLVMVILSELFYLRFPYEIEYLLPLMPFIAVLFSFASFSKRQIMVLAFAIASYAGVSFNIAKPDSPDKVSKARVGLYVEKGYLVSDIMSRMKQN